MKRTIGVLALQGAFAKHMEVLESLGADAVEVRDPEDLIGIEGLVIPGGESTTMSKMLVRWGLIEPVRNLIQGGLPVFGTCAGLILLADHLVNWDDLPRPAGLNITVARNAYGRQIDSFEAALDIELPGIPELSGMPFTGVFIRAPQIQLEPLGDDVEVLCRFEGLPVLVRKGSIIGSTFHPELSGDNRLHAWFLNDVVGSAGVGQRAG
ncbi:MAG: pyridoxal 5'-phosphate synthase glutaminase subunit PdxT [Spirochaetaceae bacterium]|nr:pyridoxal 5'-phosphate synthase glutaminase subunit PdxT [Spirochaetaceae bacterium]